MHEAFPESVQRSSQIIDFLPDANIRYRHGREVIA